MPCCWAKCFRFSTSAAHKHGVNNKVRANKKTIWDFAMLPGHQCIQLALHLQVAIFPRRSHWLCCGFLQGQLLACDSRLSKQACNLTSLVCWLNVTGLVVFPFFPLIAFFEQSTPFQKVLSPQGSSSSDEVCWKLLLTRRGFLFCHPQACKTWRSHWPVTKILKLEIKTVLSNWRWQN